MKDIIKFFGKVLLWIILVVAWFIFICPGVKLSFNLSWWDSIWIALLPSIILGSLFTRETIKDWNIVLSFFLLIKINAVLNFIIYPTNQAAVLNLILKFRSNNTYYVTDFLTLFEKNRRTFSYYSWANTVINTNADSTSIKAVPARMSPKFNFSRNFFIIFSSFLFFFIM